MIMASLCIILSFATPSHAFSDQVIQQGATGDDVVELQSRLQYIGFYNKKIDGVYGWSTYWAVRNYQNEFGIEVDGLVGPQMKDMLSRSTDYDEAFVLKALNEGRSFTHYGKTPKSIQKGPQGSAKKQGGGSVAQQPQPGQQGGGETAQQPPQEQGGEVAQQPPAEQPVPYDEEPEAQDNEANIEKATNVPAGYSDNDIQIMAQAVYGEARGESYVGQVAIAAVIINRLNSPTFPNTVSGVIFEPRAFTAVADGQIYMQPNETARRAVVDALNGQDPTGNALYYFNPDTATSGWIWSRPQIKRIGKHIFCH
ncbi:spore cortex-lytic enzyme [Bacillus solitudinis]|uniref:spore cortex-lytic enzyme n=1 Tax=Bacillus solitudinis TaxID=2014074 RepID=UPI0038734F19